MRPPPGVDLLPGQALLIRRSLYGLKQAARDWHERCVKELRKLGFEQTAADPCLLIYKERFVLLLVNWFKNEFRQIFKVKDLGEIDKILGIRITRDGKRRAPYKGPSIVPHELEWGLFRAIHLEAKGTVHGPQSFSHPTMAVGTQPYERLTRVSTPSNLEGIRSVQTIHLIRGCVLTITYRTLSPPQTCLFARGPRFPFSS